MVRAILNWTRNPKDWCLILSFRPKLYSFCSTSMELQSNKSWSRIPDLPHTGSLLRRGIFRLAGRLRNGARGIRRAGTGEKGNGSARGTIGQALSIVPLAPPSFYFLRFLSIFPVFSPFLNWTSLWGGKRHTGRITTELQRDWEGDDSCAWKLPRRGSKWCRVGLGELTHMTRLG